MSRRVSPEELGFTIATQYRRWQSRYKNRFKAMKKGMLEIAEEATSGPHGLDELALLGHPYAKRHFDPEEGSRAATEKARIAGLQLSQAAGIINTQDPEGFRANWQFKVKSLFDGEEIDVSLFNPTMTKSGHLLADLLFNGTPYMIARPTLSYILARSEPLFQRWQAGVQADWDGVFR